MDLAALFLACSLHPDDRLVESLAFFYSQGSAYAVARAAEGSLDVDDESLELAPSSLTAARSAVARILAAGGVPIVGLLPVRLEWATEFGKSVEQLFDPCTNIAVASAKLSEFDYACRAKGPHVTAAARRVCTLAHYAGSVRLPGLQVVVLADLASHPSEWTATPNPSDDEAGADAPLATDAHDARPFTFQRNPGIFFSLPAAPSAPSPAPVQR